MVKVQGIDFLVYGVPRSGTSATAGIISAIKGTYCLNEVFDVPLEHEKIRIPHSLHEVAKTVANRATVESVEDAIDFLSNNDHKRIMLGNKMPKYYLRIDEKLRQLPAAKAILCVRNLKSVMLSYNARARKSILWHPGYTAEYAVAEYIYCLKSLLRDKSDRTLVLPQEVLLSDPLLCLQSISLHLWGNRERAINPKVFMQYCYSSTNQTHYESDLSIGQKELFEHIYRMQADDIYSGSLPLIASELDSHSEGVINNLPDEVLSFIKPYIQKSENPDALAYWDEFERMIKFASPIPDRNSRKYIISSQPFLSRLRSNSLSQYLETDACEVAEKPDTRNDFMIPKLNKDEIFSVYRAILGRNPESNEVIESHISSGATLEEFIRTALNSPEFTERDLQGASHKQRSLKSGSVIDIEVSGTANQMRSLIQHMESVWTRFGVEDAYFSVITEEKYRKNGLSDKIITEFYEQGADDQKAFEAILRHNGIILNKNSTVLDFGCGVGRVGIHFAEYYEKYIGVDISISHLRQAKDYFQKLGKKNAEFLLLTEFLTQAGIADFIFSVIVLQHNPPPVIAQLIERMCIALRPGGTLLFQVPTSLIGYRFSLKQYLEQMRGQGGMEMHAVPQKEVFRILRSQGCTPVEVFEYDKIGPIGESTFFVAVKDS